MIDYLMVMKTYCCLMKDVKAILCEECISHHRMIIGRLVIPMNLKDEDTARLFTREMAAINYDVDDDQTDRQYSYSSK